MTATETKLFQLLNDRSFQRGTFRLASGAMSDYYIDGKMVQVFSESAHLIGEVLYERTRDVPLDALGGLEIGAVPLTTAAVISYHLHGRTMEGFWVRDKAKSHGTRKVVEGNVKPGLGGHRGRCHHDGRLLHQGHQGSAGDGLRGRSGSRAGGPSPGSGEEFPGRRDRELPGHFHDPRFRGRSLTLVVPGRSLATRSSDLVIAQSD